MEGTRNAVDALSVESTASMFDVLSRQPPRFLRQPAMRRRAILAESPAQLDMFPDIRGSRGEVSMRSKGGRVTKSGRIAYDIPRG